jgi:hypothetical protein
MIVPGMSHALPITLWPKNIGAIDKHAHGAKSEGARRSISSYPTKKPGVTRAL